MASVGPVQEDCSMPWLELRSRMASLRTAAKVHLSKGRPQQWQEEQPPQQPVQQPQHLPWYPQQPQQLPHTFQEQAQQHVQRQLAPQPQQQLLALADGTANSTAGSNAGVRPSPPPSVAAADHVSQEGDMSSADSSISASSSSASRAAMASALAGAANSYSQVDSPPPNMPARLAHQDLLRPSSRQTSLDSGASAKPPLVGSISSISAVVETTAFSLSAAHTASDDARPSLFTYTESVQETICEHADSATFSSNALVLEPPASERDSRFTPQPGEPARTISSAANSSPSDTSATAAVDALVKAAASMSTAARQRQMDVGSASSRSSVQVPGASANAQRTSSIDHGTARSSGTLPGWRATAANQPDSHSASESGLGVGQRASSQCSSAREIPAGQGCLMQVPPLPGSSRRDSDARPEAKTGRGYTVGSRSNTVQDSPKSTGNPPSLPEFTAQAAASRPAAGGSTPSTPQSPWSLESETRLKELFDIADSNKDGRLNKREVIKCCRAHKDVARFFRIPQNIKQEDGSRDQFEFIFQEIDVNEDREITWDELVTWFRTVLRCRRQSTLSVEYLRAQPPAQGQRQPQAQGPSQPNEEPVFSPQPQQQSQTQESEQQHHQQQAQQERQLSAGRRPQDPEPAQQAQSEGIPSHASSMPPSAGHAQSSARSAADSCGSSGYPHSDRMAASAQTDSGIAQEYAGSDGQPAESAGFRAEACDETREQLYDALSPQSAGHQRKRAVLEKNLSMLGLSGVMRSTRMPLPRPYVPHDPFDAIPAVSSTARPGPSLVATSTASQAPSSVPAETFAREAQADRNCRVARPPDYLPHLATRLGENALKDWLEQARLQFQWADEAGSGRISGVEAIQLCRHLRYARGGSALHFAAAAPFLPRFVFHDDGKLGFEEFCRFSALLDLLTGEVSTNTLVDGQWQAALVLLPAAAIQSAGQFESLTPFGPVMRWTFASVPQAIGPMRCVQLAKAKLAVPEDFARGEMLRLARVPATAALASGRGDVPMVARRIVGMLEDHHNFYLLQEWCLAGGPEPWKGSADTPDGPCDLVEWLARAGTGPPIPTVAWWIARTLGQLLCGLEHLHAHGVLHLGICPETVVVSGSIGPTHGGLPAIALLTDQGLGSLFSEVAPPLAEHLGWNELLSSRRVLGAAAGPVVVCSAPEVSAGMACAASDVYAVGCVLYVLLFGRSPPRAGNLGVVPGAPVRPLTPTPPPEQLSPIPHKLLALCQQMREPGATCRPTISAARVVAAAVADSLVGKQGSYQKAVRDDAAEFAPLIQRWRAFGLKELQRRTALQKVAVEVSNQLGSEMPASGSPVLGDSAAGLLAADPTSTETASEHSVLALVRRALPSHVVRCPSVCDALLLAAPELAPLQQQVPAEDEDFWTPDDVSVQQQASTAAVVTLALQAAVDAYECKLGSERGRAGGLVVPATTWQQHLVFERPLQAPVPVEVETVGQRLEHRWSLPNPALGGSARDARTKELPLPQRFMSAPIRRVTREGA